MASIEPAAPDATVLDLYRAAWSGLQGGIVRYRLAIAIEVGMIALWFILRTGWSVESRPYLAWTVLACAIALVSPTSGLVLLVATAPFFEPVMLTRALGLRHVLVAALGVSVALRLAAGGWRHMPRSPTLILGIVVALITIGGVAHTLRDFNPEFGTHAAQTWITNIGGAMILLIVGAWVARTGEARPMVVAAIACAVASVLSLMELSHPGLISNGALSWIGFWKDFGARVTGIIPAPNAVATMLIVPATVSLAGVVQLHGRRRLAALVVAIPIAAAAILTLSRSAIAALYITAVLFIARRRRRTAWIVLVVGIVLAVVSVPLFIQFRAAQQGVFETRTPIDWILGADEARITAWGAAIRMWADSPIIGHGFLAYKQLADAFGDTRLGSPHNEVLRLFAEEGLIGGIALIAFILVLFRELSRRPGWIGSGLLAGAIGYWLAAMFNNPLLFIQVSAMAFVFFGYGLAAPVPAEAAIPPTATAPDEAVAPAPQTA